MKVKTERIDRAVYLKSGSYWVVKRNKWTGPFSSLESGKKERDKIEVEQTLKPEGGPFADFMRKHYYPHYLAKMKTNTRLVYKGIYENDFMPFFATKRIADITSLDINEFQEHLRNKGLQAVTINMRIALLKMIFKSAKELGFVQNNPLEVIKNLRKIKKDRTILTEKGIIELIEKIDHPYRYAIALAGLAGARAGEVMGFKWEDFDLSEKGKISFKRQINKLGEVDELKSSGSVATLPIVNALTGLLLEYKSKCPDLEWLFQGRFTDYMAKVRATKNGPTYKYHRKPRHQKLNFSSGDSLSAWWGRNRLQYGLETMRFHDFRHSFATNMVTRCANIKTAQKLCRHANVNTTLEIYTHTRPEQLEEIYSWDF